MLWICVKQKWLCISQTEPSHIPTFETERALENGVFQHGFQVTQSQKSAFSMKVSCICFHLSLDVHVRSSPPSQQPGMHQDIRSNLPRGLKPSGKLKERQNQVLPIFNALQHAAAYVFLSRNTKQIVSSGVCEQRSQLSLYTQITVQKGENSYTLRVTAELLRRHWGISCQYVFVCTAITWGSTPLLPRDESLHTWW